ncbi:MAG: DVU0298 family protein [Chloroflexota bacterium]
MDVKPLVASAAWDELEALARANRRTMSRILALTYQPEGLLRWRAVEALGRTAGVVAVADAEFVRGILRRLHWSLSDESGGIGWSAPEAMGAIVAARPDLFADYALIVVSLAESLEEDYFHAGILWAIARLATAGAPQARQAEPWLRECRGDSRPLVRGLAAWGLGLLAPPDLAHLLHSLRSDQAPLEVYREGNLEQTTVAALARQALGEGE